MKTRLIPLAILLLTLSSCEYEDSYEYRIENRLDNTITIVGGSLVNYYSLTVLKKDTLVVLPNETLRIYSHGGGVSGKDNEPEDIRYRYWSVDTVLIEVRDTVLVKNFGAASLWNYSAGPNRGTYTLTITEDLIKN